MNTDTYTPAGRIGVGLDDYTMWTWFRDAGDRVIIESDQGDDFEGDDAYIWLKGDWKRLPNV